MSREDPDLFGVVDECIEKCCKEPVDQNSSYWCKRHEDERIKRIDSQLHRIESMFKPFRKGGRKRL